MLVIKPEILHPLVLTLQVHQDNLSLPQSKLEHRTRNIFQKEYRKVSKMSGHARQQFKVGDTNQDTLLDLAEFTRRAQAKLKTFEKHSVNTKKAKW